MFVHGGSWRTGDRSLYRALGIHFARAGIAVAIPSYRLMPQNPHPAQIEDVAAAFAWMYRNIPRYGGDLKRVYLAGDSAGGHLVALLALDPTYLSKYDIPAHAIHGVVSMSGVYDVRNMREFVFEGDRNRPRRSRTRHRRIPSRMPRRSSSRTASGTMRACPSRRAISRRRSRGPLRRRG